MKGSGYCILCGSVGSESILMRIQAGRDVVFDVLENQFLREVGRVDTASLLGTGGMVAVLKETVVH